MNWFILALISIFSISIANIIQKVLMKDDDSDPYVYAIVFQFVITIITGIFALIVGFNLPPIREYPINFLLSGCLYAAGTLFVFKALKTIDASENILISPFGALATILSAVIFLNERLGLYRIIGALLIFIPVILLNFNKSKFKLKVGTLYAICMSLCYGLAVTNDAYILKSYDAISYTPVISFIPGLILLLIKPKSVINFTSYLQLKRTRNMLLLGFFYGVQAITYYLALTRGAEASQMAIIFKLEIIITVLFATLFLKERKNLLLKFIGSIIAITGALLLR